MTKIQQRLLNRIQANGNTTVRVYNNGTGRYIFRAAQGLRAQGVVSFRGVGRGSQRADSFARSVYLRQAATV